MSVNAADRHLIIEAITKYAWGFDENDFSLVASAFSKNAVSGGKVAGTEIAWGPMRGREEIVNALQGMRNSQTDRRRHCLSNFHFTSQTEDSATVRCYMTLLSAGDGKVSLVTVGIFDADLARLDRNDWLLTRLDITLDAPF
ncbi:nuclear transport factor 2 family protein [Rhizobium sp. YTU87027]|uniref:nuclear transport factor 2 family protein n=1 Tax=Rhizobium sp. YTU87027 TaxID=3417741 RepID=UPI003D6894D7